MVDLEKVDGFDWDAGNVRKSEEKHGVSQTEVEQIFFNAPLVVAPDPSTARMNHALTRSARQTQDVCCTSPSR